MGFLIMGAIGYFIKLSEYPLFSYYQRATRGKAKRSEIGQVKRSERHNGIIAVVPREGAEQ